MNSNAADMNDDEAFLSLQRNLLQQINQEHGRVSPNRTSPSAPLVPLNRAISDSKTRTRDDVSIAPRGFGIAARHDMPAFPSAGNHFQNEKLSRRREKQEVGYESEMKMPIGDTSGGDRLAFSLHNQHAFPSMHGQSEESPDSLGFYAHDRVELLDDEDDFEPIEILQQTLATSKRPAVRLASGTATTALAPRPPIDVYPLLVSLSGAMEKSQLSQQAIHDWDKKMGLKRSHSKTMRLSFRTRKKCRAMLKKQIRAALKKKGKGKKK